MSATENDYCQYYIRQCGGALPHYQGRRFQKGHGIGSILSSTFRKAVSMAPGVLTGIVGDTLAGHKPSTAVKNRLLKAGRHVGHNLVDNVLLKALNSGSGDIKRPAQKRSSRSHPPRKKARRAKKKGKRVGDIFD